MNETEKIIWPGWETVQLIGRGSFGAVYEIQRENFGMVEKAALKVISIPQNSGDIEELYSDGYDEESITSTFRSRLESVVAEYSMMRQLNGCANIVNSEDLRYIEHKDGIGWDILIKMELLTPLTKAVVSGISEEEIVKLAKDMCEALKLCKIHGIVHRDIKPQNIFVSEHGDYKLGDFGIAKTIEGTIGGTKIGTYKYMAPEVYHNQPYGSSSDLYSLGLVLYWLLNERRMPFMPLPPAKLTTGMEEKARQRRLAGELIPPPANGSEELKRIVLKACAFHQGNRYSSAEEMYRDICKLENEMKQAAENAKRQAAALSGEIIFCKHCGGKNQKGARFCRVCGGDISIAPPPPQPQPQPQPQFQPQPQPVAQPKKKKKTGLFIGLGCGLAALVVLILLLCGVFGHPITHKMEKSWTSINGWHYHACAEDHCDYKKNKEPCHGGTATCERQANCVECGKPYGRLEPCSYTREKVAEEYLWMPANCSSAAVYFVSCPVCGEAGEETFTYGSIDPDNHVFNNYVCEYCGEEDSSVTQKEHVWSQEGNYWYCYIDGEKVTGWYTFEEGTYLFLPEDGRMQASAWGKRRDPNTGEERDCYHTMNGRLATGWAQIEGEKYYFDENGLVVTGWQTIGDKIYLFLPDERGRTMCSNWGTRKDPETGKEKSCYFTQDGSLAVGWAQIEEKWYYFDENGIILQLTWQEINGYHYYFNANGEMVTGWVPIDGHEYYFNADGQWQDFG